MWFVLQPDKPSHVDGSDSIDRIEKVDGFENFENFERDLVISEVGDHTHHCHLLMVAAIRKPLIH